jgi:hypothetical protein
MYLQFTTKTNVCTCDSSPTYAKGDEEGDFSPIMLKDGIIYGQGFLFMEEISVSSNW